MDIKFPVVCNYIEEFNFVVSDANGELFSGEVPLGEDKKLPYCFVTGKPEDSLERKKATKKDLEAFGENASLCEWNSYATYINIMKSADKKYMTWEYVDDILVRTIYTDTFDEDLKYI